MKYTRFYPNINVTLINEGGITNNMIDGEMITAIVFYALLFLFIYIFRKKFTIMNKILFISSLKT